MYVFDGRVAYVWSVGCKCAHLIPCGLLFDTFHNWLWGKLRWFKCSLKECDTVVCCYCCCLQCMWDTRWRSWLRHCGTIRKVLKKRVCFWRDSPQRARPSSFTRFLYHNDAPQSVGLPTDEWSARRRNLYLTTHNTHDRQTSMPPVGFEPTISAGEWPQTYALDRAATGTGLKKSYILNFIIDAKFNI